MDKRPNSRFPNGRFRHEYVTQAFPHHINQLDFANMNQVASQWVHFVVHVHLKVSSNLVKSKPSVLQHNMYAAFYSRLTVQ